MSADKLLRVTVEQIGRMYAVVPPEARNGAEVIDAILALLPTADEAEWVLGWVDVAQHDTFPIARKMVAIADSKARLL